EHYRYRRTFQLLLDPLLDTAGALLRLLELCRVVEWLRLALCSDDPTVPDLNNTTDVALVVKAEKHLPGHAPSPKDRTPAISGKPSVVSRANAPAPTFTSSSIDQWSDRSPRQAETPSSRLLMSVCSA